MPTWKVSSYCLLILLIAQIKHLMLAQLVIPSGGGGDPIGGGSALNDENMHTYVIDIDQI